MGCHPAVQTHSSSGGGGFLHFLKAAGNFIYHASGAADVVGCIRNPTLGGCLKAAGAVALTVMTAGDGMVLRTVAEGGAELAMRGLATRAATRVVETLGAAGRAARAGLATARDAVNPVIGTEEVAAPTIRYVGDGVNGQRIVIPTLRPVRLFGNTPIRSTLEAGRSALEFFDRLPIQAQDQATIPIEDIIHHIHP